MNRKTAEKIAAIVLLSVLCVIFVIQNAHVNLIGWDFK
jgi:hypothetical protein